MGNLPMNLILKIAHDLAFSNIISMSFVNKHFHNKIIGNNNFWRSHCLHKFGLDKIPDSVLNWRKWYQQHANAIFKVAPDKKVDGKFVICDKCPKPRLIENKVTMVACGAEHTAIISLNVLYVNGDNTYGQLGRTDIESSTHFVKLAENVSYVDCGLKSTVYLDFSKVLYGCGNNMNGSMLGIANKKVINQPARILDNISKVICSKCVIFVEVTNIMYVSSKFESKIFVGTTFHPVGNNIISIHEEANRLTWLQGYTLYTRTVEVESIIAVNVKSFCVANYSSHLYWIDINNNLYRFIIRDDDPHLAEERLFDLYTNSPITKSKIDRPLWSDIVKHRFILNNVKKIVDGGDFVHILTCDRKVYLIGCYPIMNFYYLSFLMTMAIEKI